MTLSGTGLRFILVGAAATLLHMLVALLLITLVKLSPAMANGLAFLAANFFSYFSNTKWTFKAAVEMKNGRRFFMVSIFAWLCTISIAWGVDKAGGHYLLGLALVVSLVPALSFWAHRSFTYR